MFGISFVKLVVLAVAVSAAWYGLKYLTRLQDGRDGEPSRNKGRSRSGTGESRPVEDMVACRICGAYVPGRNATNCGRSDCPYS